MYYRNKGNMIVCKMRKFTFLFLYVKICKVNI